MAQPLSRDRLRLIVITDAALSRPRGVEWVVEQALDAGAPAIQLRAKNTSARELSAMAEHLVSGVHAASALFFVNDRLDVALAVGADGVHLGPDDISVAEVRAIVPDGFLVGYSTDDPDEAVRAEADGADYLGSGTVYATSNKADAGDVIGVQRLRQVVEAVSIPVVGIGGITPARAPSVAETGASGVAVIGAVMAATDPASVVRELMAPFT